MGTISFKAMKDDTRSVISKIKDEYKRAKQRESRNKSMVFQSQAMTWDSPKVAAWLDFLGLVEYARTFLKHGVDGPTLLQLSEDQIMRGLNMNRKTHVYSLTTAIADLQESNVDYDSWEWTSQGVQKWLVERGLDILCEKFAEEGVHGGVLFRSTQEEFVNELNVGHETSPLVIVSLMTAIRHARQNGRYGVNNSRVADWGPDSIYHWLCSLHLAHLNDLFREHCIHGTLLLQLNQEILQATMGLSEIQAIVIARAIQRLNNMEHRTGKDAIRSNGKRISSANSNYDDVTDSGSINSMSESGASEYAVPFIQDDPLCYSAPRHHQAHHQPNHPRHHHERAISMPHINTEQPPAYPGMDSHQRHQSMPRHFQGLYTHHEPYDGTKRANVKPVNTEFSQKVRNMRSVCNGNFLNKFDGDGSPTNNNMRQRGNGGSGGRNRSRPGTAYSSSGEGEAPSPGQFVDGFHRSGGPGLNSTPAK